MLLSTPFDFEPSHVFIDGVWRAPSSGQTMALVNPSTGAALCNIAIGDASDIDAAVAAGTSALNGEWGKATALQRGRFLVRLGQLVLEHVEDLAKLEALDVGKP